MPQETKTAYDNPRSNGTSLEGLVANREDEAALLDALEKAFDYRGDITIGRTDSTIAEGYIFDRRRGNDLASSNVRLMNKAGERIEIAFDQISTIEFTGKDTAAGKSFERWIQRYIEKKKAGEQASIESESLD